MCCIWAPILELLDTCNQVIQAREARNIEGLVSNLSNLDADWPRILEEAKAMANKIDVPCYLVKPCSSSHLTNKEMIDSFKMNVFDRIVNSVHQGINKQFQGIQKIVDFFQFIWKYPCIEDQALENSCSAFCDLYKEVSKTELVGELRRLQISHQFNFEENFLKPLALLNKITEMNLESIFPNISITLRIFFTLPVTVASAERSFSKLKLIKNYLRSTMAQDRLVDLAVLI